MKHLSLIFAIISSCFYLTACSSCDNSEKDREQDLKRRREQIASDKAKREEHTKDLEQKYWYDSLAIRAWGDAVFGMNQKEMNSTRAFGSGHDLTLHYGSLERKYIEMADTRFSEFKKTFNLKYATSIRGEMYKGELREITLLSKEVEYDELDQLAVEAIKLIDKFKERYESPTKMITKISENDFDDNNMLSIARWKFGSKIGKIKKDIHIYLYRRKVESTYEHYLYTYSVTISPFTTISRDEEAYNWIRRFNEEKNRRDDIWQYSF